MQIICHEKDGQRVERAPSKHNHHKRNQQRRQDAIFESASTAVIDSIVSCSASLLDSRLTARRQHAIICVTYSAIEY